MSGSIWGAGRACLPSGASCLSRGGGFPLYCPPCPRGLSATGSRPNCCCGCLCCCRHCCCGGLCGLPWPATSRPGKPPISWLLLSPLSAKKASRRPRSWLLPSCCGTGTPRRAASRCASATPLTAAASMLEPITQSPATPTRLRASKIHSTRGELSGRATSKIKGTSTHEAGVGTRAGAPHHWRRAVAASHRCAMGMRK